MQKILLSLMLLFCATAVMAQDVSEDEAKAKAAQFLTKSVKMRKVAANGNAKLTLAPCDAENIYVFNVGDDNGYVIVSGDSRTRSILGYGRGHGFDMDKAPENMKAWLKGYGIAISEMKDKVAPKSRKAYTQGDDMSDDNETEPYGKAIEPLLKSKWSQSEPYNDQCPIYNGERCITGCVATAMAQVLYYWKAPQHWVASIPAYIAPYDARQFVVDEIPSTRLRWDDMCDTYDEEDNRTEEQKSAVAELMRCCGQSVKMMYSPSMSGAVGFLVADALKKYFGFSESTRSVERRDYTISEWESMIYDNLSRGIPVPYGGRNEVGGHEFVCDGYDGNGMFHINWGWGGQDDNFFLLSLLKPYTDLYYQTGFNIGQSVIIDAEPSDHPACEVPFLSNGFIQPEQNMLTLWGTNMSTSYGVFEMALAVKGDDGNFTPVVTNGNSAIGLEPGYQDEFKFDMMAAGLKPGIYDLHIMYRCVSVPGDTWHDLFGERYIHTVVDDTSVKITPMPAMNLVVEDLRNLSEGYAYEKQRLVLKLRNDSAKEHSDCLNITITYEGDQEGIYTQNAYTSAYVPAHGTAEAEILLEPTASGDATFTITSDQDLTAVVATPHILFKEPRQEFIDAFSIPEYTANYTVSDDGDLTVNLHYKVTNTFKGVVLRDVTACVVNGDSIVMQSPKLWKFDPNETRTKDVTYTFSAEELEMHAITPVLNDGIDFAFLGRLGIDFQPFFDIHIPYGKTVTQDGEYSGITEIITTTTDSPIYDLQGRRLKHIPARGIVIQNGKKVLRK